jgi:hypothetical protein
VRIRTLIATGGLFALTAALGACALVPLPSAEPDDWVVVRFEYTGDPIALDAFDALIDTELAADAALDAADAGWIDGNEIGDNRYGLYFVGQDRRKMWSILEPVLAEAPVSWTAVELRNGFEDAAPTVIDAG